MKEVKVIFMQHPTYGKGFIEETEQTLTQLINEKWEIVTSCATGTHSDLLLVILQREKTGR